MTNNNHSHGCGCGHSGHGHSGHGHKCCGKHKHNNVNPLDMLSHTEIHFLKHLLEYKFLPVAQFVLKSTQESSFEIISLTPVFIIDENDTIEEIKTVGSKLTNLENLGFITLDYDIPLESYPYSEYHNSSAFAYYKQTIAEAQGKPNFIGDTATIACGSIAPTELCASLK